MILVHNITCADLIEYTNYNVMMILQDKMREYSNPN